ncbi:hypothetical protein ONZ51_g3556 [Trametes cubensis]|uniref:F-box domain-containing protein n=1 Tax=Trametes cubensis TaxID=1111947 RepID=A0AAD7TZW5_9APHY|nr:hypothetical protein ONZ51_g3556 [Trametes cubensis]
MEVCTSLGLLAPGQKQAFALQQIEKYRREIEELHQRIHLLNIEANNDSLIFRMLPNELLMEIFRFLRPTERNEIRIVHVCSAWRTILRNTPEFWADLASIPDLVTAKTEDDWSCYLSCLALSSPRSLRLSLRGNRIPRMPEVHAYLPRITSLTLTFVDSQMSKHLPDLYEFFALGLPALEDLELTAYNVLFDAIADMHDHGHHYFSSDNKLPRLRTLRTHGIFFAAALACSSLRHVILVNEKPQYLGDRTYLEAHSYPVFVDALRRCSDLETLDIAYSLPRGEDPTGPPDYSQPPVHLGNLRTLTVSDETWHIRRFFEAVSFPSTTTITVRNLAPKWRSSFAEVLPRTRKLEVMSSLEDVALYLCNLSWTCCLRCFAGDTERFTIHTNWLYYVESFRLEELLEVFPLGPLLTVLDITLDDNMPIEDERWDQLLEEFNDIIALSLGNRSCRKLAEALARATSQQYPLPHLEELRVWHDGDEAEVEAERALLEGVVRLREAAGLKMERWGVKSSEDHWSVTVDS